MKAHFLPTVAALPFALSLVWSTSCLVAQGDDLARAIQALPSVLPVHRATDGAPGLHAGGSSYRVEFADGMRFRPNIEAATDSTPAFVWRTESIRVGDHDLRVPDLGAAVAADSRVVEARAGEVVERYEIRGDGVEQSFVIGRR